MTILSLLWRPCFMVTKPNLLISPTKPHFLQHVFNYHNIFTSKCYYSSVANAFSENDSGVELKSTNDQLYSTYGLERDSMPNHIAICLDGNRRWLQSHGRDLDYTPFFQRNFDFAQLCLKWGVRKGTSFMWGLGNFTKRGDDANDIFLGQFQKFLEDNFEYFKRNEIKVLAVGETSMLSESQQATVRKVEEGTKNYTNLELSLAVCYSGKRDITNATRKICEKVRQGIIEAKDINEDMIEKELSIPSSPLPDLFLRTGDEIRVGALLSWQVAHTELYFTNTLAPDFAEDIFVDALRSYQQRDRKFGK